MPLDLMASLKLGINIQLYGLNVPVVVGLATSIYKFISTHADQEVLNTSSSSSSSSLFSQPFNAYALPLHMLCCEFCKHI